MLKSSYEIAVQSSKKVLERGAWAGPGGYTKVSHPTPWRLRSRHYVTMANQSIINSPDRAMHVNNILKSPN